MALGPVAWFFLSLRPHAVIRLLVPHTNDKSKQLASHL